MDQKDEEAVLEAVQEEDYQNNLDIALQDEEDSVQAAFEAGVQKPHLRLGLGTGSLNTKLGLLWAPYLSSLIGFFAHPGQVLPHIAALGAWQCSPEMDFWLCFPV